MHIQTMEGLLGAKTNMNMLEGPIRIYREAERRGDLGAMERAGNYITEFAGRKDDYRKEIEKGMEQEREDSRKEKKKEQQEGQRTSDQAASLAISQEGREVWMQAADATSGEEEIENENCGSDAQCAGTGK